MTSYKLLLQEKTEMVTSVLINCKLILKTNRKPRLNQENPDKTNNKNHLFNYLIVCVSDFLMSQKVSIKKLQHYNRKVYKVHTPIYYIQKQNKLSSPTINKIYTHNKIKEGFCCCT